MPIIDSFPQGTPIWVDLQSTDQAGAAAFYRQLFEWELPAASAETGGYSVATMRGVPVTAIGPLPPTMPAGSRSVWTTYFTVDDIDASAAAATAAGGAVLLPPGELAPGVQLSIVADPAGAVFGLWQKEKDSPWLREEPGAVDWVELVEGGCESSFDFYENVLGVGTSQMAMGDGVYSLFDVGETSVAGAIEPAADIPPHWLVYFNVADLDAAVVRLTELGGTLLNERGSAPGVGRWVTVVDPFGGAFALLEPEPEAA
ncbi:VOC family protein [Leifsonia poae]|uniref:Glyoxylase CFP32 n=1 Tax=Leifsonia poae TaxID=110933 RepID=A0A9W6HC97_9MICO|nr:VOC family protein [Leifsonia poae]GLJ77516.1 putative glyoxylase CFP32 [Leifsonia poae]